MPQTINFREIPRFLACPGSGLMSDKAELLLGPVDPTGAGEDLSLEPLLPIKGFVDQIDSTEGLMLVTMSGVTDPRILTAAALAAYAKYDWRYEYKEFELKNEHETLALMDLDTLQASAAELNQQFIKASNSVDLNPTEHCSGCPGRSVCSKLDEYVSDPRLDDLKELTGAEMAVNHQLLTARLTGLESAIHKMILDGVQVDGFVLGPPRRTWKDEGHAMKYLIRNVKQGKKTVTETRLLSVDAVEKALETAELSRAVNLDGLIEVLPGTIKARSTDGA